MFIVYASCMLIPYVQLGSKVILQEPIREFEVCLPTVHPSTLVVEEPVCALLKLFRNVLRLLVPLKPRLILLVETPALLLQSFRRQILLVRALPVVKGVEQAVGVDPLVEHRVREYS